MATGDFESVYTHAQILDANTPDAGNLSLIRNSFFLPRSPHLTVTPKIYVYLSDAVGGTGHGTPHDYDRHVPVVFMAPWAKPGRYADPCGPEDIAPTLADRLGLEFPRESDSRILVEMMKELKATTTGL